MKTFEIEWETCFCEDFPEKSGVTAIQAESESEAVKKFNENPPYHSVIIGVEERK